MRAGRPRSRCSYGDRFRHCPGVLTRRCLSGVSACLIMRGVGSSLEKTAMPDAASVLTPELLARRDHLLEILRSLGRVAVAFSGGIDSTVVAQAAFLALGDR